MKKKYGIIYLLATLFVFSVFLPTTKAKSFCDNEMRPCVIVEPFITVSETRYYAANEKVLEEIFVRKSGYYGSFYEGYIKKVSSVVVSTGGAQKVTYKGVIYLTSNPR